MKNRIRQRENRKARHERLLNFKDECGVNDPTPYEAVRGIIDEFNLGNDKRGSNSTFDKFKQ